MNNNPDTVIGELGNNVHHFCVSEIGDIFLEGQTEDGDGGPLDRLASGDEHLYRFLRHVFAHSVIDSAAGQYYFGMIPQRLGFHRQVIGIDSNTMPTDQAGTEVQKVPLGSRRFENLGGVDADFVEDHRQLIHQRNVQVALSVFDDLGGLGDFN